MISRRGLFKMLGAVAASPALKPLAKLMPETYTTYLLGREALVSYNVRYDFSPRHGHTMRLRRVGIPDPGYEEVSKIPLGNTIYQL